MAETTRTYWLSFADAELPTGQQFLGALVVDVTEQDAAAARVILGLNPELDASGDGPWIAAAVRAAWKARVNPGGEVASARIDGAPNHVRFPRLTLLSRADVEALDRLPA